jgi:hypothetical protein
MAETATTTEFSTADEPSLTESEAQTISTLAEELNAEDADSLRIYEGALSGALYVETGVGYERAELAPTGLSITPIDSPREELEPLARIEPDEGETVHDAVDSLTFAGGD